VDASDKTTRNEAIFGGRGCGCGRRRNRRDGLTGRVEGLLADPLETPEDQGEENQRIAKYSAKDGLNELKPKAKKSST